MDNKIDLYSTSTKAGAKQWKIIIFIYSYLEVVQWY